MLEVGTSYLLDNEPCFLLTELNSMPKKGKVHRYRNTYVIRGDRIAKHVFDMGPAKKHKHDEFRIPGGGIETNGRIWIVHTVAELMGIADHLRDSKGFNKEALVGTKIRNP